MAQYNKEFGKNVDVIDPNVYALLSSHSWPGNVRQLQNWVERAMATIWKNVLTPEQFYWTSYTKPSQPQGNLEQVIPSLGEGTAPLSERMEAIERTIIQRTLLRNHWNKTKAAQALGISRQMLHRKIKQFLIIQPE